MAVNKVICNSSVLIDLTQDTVTADRLGYGITAHDKAGNIITGTSAIPLIPKNYDHHIGYIQNGTWIYENPTGTYIDIYQVKADNSYFYTLGKTVGSRFRTMFTTTDVTTVTSGRVAGTGLINKNDPAAYSNGVFNCTQDGYFMIAKDNVGVANLKTYVYNITQSWI